MQDTQQLLRVLEVIVRFNGENPYMITPDRHIARELGLELEDVRGYMHLLAKRGLTRRADNLAGRGAVPTDEGRLALKTPDLLNTPALPATNYFDQRGQTVQHQYNAARDINFSTVQNAFQLVDELGKLKAEVRKAGDEQVIEGEIVDEAEHQLAKAITQAKKPVPDKKTIIEHLTSAKSVIEGATAATGLINAVTAAIDAVQNLLS
ncbi:MAG TPA: hypothetical protein VLA19_26760 [Herpetosiphonaceae bacterium]|nr:hypothetical protein [Herpetosiphonaceae bacterium]